MDWKSIWNSFEEWGLRNPVRLAILAFLAGVIPPGVIAFGSGYNIGMYEGTTTTENLWRGQFDEKLKERVNAQLALKCGQAVSDVERTCNKQTARLESTINDKDVQIRAQNSQIEVLRKRSDILDLYGRLIDGASHILRDLETATAKNDVASERILKARFFSLLLDIRRLNQVYSDWGALFDGRATALTNEYKDAQSVPTDAIIGYLEYFTTDADRKRRVIEVQVDEANKIKSKKY